MPEEILKRTSKGGTTGYLGQIVLRNLNFLRVYIGNGVLARHGLLDLDKVRACLTEASVVRDGSCAIQLMECFGIEAWARAWPAPTLQVAA